MVPSSVSQTGVEMPRRGESSCLRIFSKRGKNVPSPHSHTAPPSGISTATELTSCLSTNDPISPDLHCTRFAIGLHLRRCWFIREPPASSAAILALESFCDRAPLTAQQTSRVLGFLQLRMWKEDWEGWGRWY